MISTAKKPRKHIPDLRHSPTDQLQLIVRRSRKLVNQQINALLLYMFWDIGALMNENANADDSSPGSSTGFPALSELFGKYFETGALTNMMRFAKCFPTRSLLYDFSFVVDWQQVEAAMEAGNVEQQRFYLLLAVALGLDSEGIQKSIASSLHRHASKLKIDLFVMGNAKVKDQHFIDTVKKYAGESKPDWNFLNPAGDNSFYDFICSTEKQRSTANDLNDTTERIVNLIFEYRDKIQKCINYRLNWCLWELGCFFLQHYPGAGIDEGFERFKKMIGELGNAGISVMSKELFSQCIELSRSLPVFEDAYPLLHNLNWGEVLCLLQLEYQNQRLHIASEIAGRSFSTEQINALIREKLPADPAWNPPAADLQITLEDVTTPDQKKSKPSYVTRSIIENAEWMKQKLSGCVFRNKNLALLR